MQPAEAKRKLAGMPFEDAIRLYLESFRLPGEAQKIYRIMDSWSQHYFAQSPGSFANADAVHVLAFSVIILNTDQHNTTACAPALPCCYTLLVMLAL